MIFAVKNRDDIERGLPLAEDYVLISISCPNDPAKIPDNEYRKDVLRLEFDDIDHPVYLLGGLKCKMFEKEDAVKILEFFNKYRDRYEYMIVHCDAGISRSAAVVAALTKIQGQSDGDYFGRRYIPNRRVYSFILEHFYSNHDRLEKPNWYFEGAGTTYSPERDAEATCWHCKKTFLCDPCDATCRLCNAPFDKKRCKEFGFLEKGAGDDK